MKKKIPFLLMFVLSLSLSFAQNTFRFGTSTSCDGKTLLVDREVYQGGINFMRGK